MPTLDRHSIGERFMQLGPCDLLHVVTFKLTKRRDIYDILDFIDKKPQIKKEKYQPFQKDLDLYFIIQKIDLQLNEKEPIFVAIFQFAFDSTVIENLLQKICLGKIMSNRVCMVQMLFYEMSEMSFREYRMFERLHLSCFYAKRCISNPFARALLQKNVLHINNLVQKTKFMDNQYQTYIKEGRQKGIKRPNIQNQLQMAIFGETHSHFQIYVCQKDQDLLRKLKGQKNNEDCKMEDCMTLEQEIDADFQGRQEMKPEMSNHETELIEQLSEMNTNLMDD